MLIFLFFKLREPPTGFAEGRKEGGNDEDRIEQKEGEKEEGRETLGQTFVYSSQSKSRLGLKPLTCWVAERKLIDRSVSSGKWD